MTLKLSTGFLIIILIISSCKHEIVEPIDLPKGLCAVWVENGNIDDITVLKKTLKFEEDKYGFEVKENGDFIERQIIGFCGTPPVSYTNYEGKWTYVNESLLDVESRYWAGANNYQLEIISLNENELMVRYNYQNN